MSEAATGLVGRAAEMVVEFGLGGTYWAADDFIRVAREVGWFVSNWEPAPKTRVTLEVNGRGKFYVHVECKAGKLSAEHAATFSSFMHRVAVLGKQIERMAADVST